MAAWLVLAAFDATASHLQASALRLAVTAVVALLAPLFWPGCAATPARTVLRVITWSAGAAALAGLTIALLGHPAQAWLRVLGSCAILMAILVLAHAAAAALEARWRERSVAADSARELGGRSMSLALALLGSMPLWLGPAGELLSARHAWVVDAIVGLSPLTHLAVASGNDLLRNQWLYQHSNLAALPVSYPELAPLTWCYGAVCLLLTLGTLARCLARRRHADATRPEPIKEKTP